MPEYDRTFDPPAPVADVSILHPVSGRASGPLRGKLDIGADLTVIPQRLISGLRLNHKGHCWTKGYDGTFTRKPVYYVRLRVDEFDLASVRCVATERSDVLVGRNVLNRFVLVLDGINSVYELQPS